MVQTFDWYCMYTKPYLCLFDEDVIVVIIILLFNLIAVPVCHFSKCFYDFDFLAGHGQDFPVPFNQY